MHGDTEQHHGVRTEVAIYPIGKWQSWQKVRNSMGGNVVSSICSLPATDLNFTSELNRATEYQIRQAIETMKQNGGKNKGRIKACERELENRRLTKKDKHGKYVSKQHLSILCNTFSSEHRLKAILNKLGEYEDAERQGLLLRLPCKVGDAIFLDFAGFGKDIDEFTVKDFHLDCFGDGEVILFCDYESDDKTLSGQIDVMNFGKTVFLTREEAEARLRELMDRKEQ